MDTVLAAHMHRWEEFFRSDWAWAWIAGGIVHLLLWAVVVWLIVRALAPWVRSRSVRGPERVLAERFADGSIGEEEYRSRLETIRAGYRR